MSVGKILNEIEGESRKDSDQEEAVEADGGGGTKKRASPVPTDLTKKEKDIKSDSKVSGEINFIL